MTLAGYPEPEIEQTLEELSARGYLNDRAFALEFARAKRTRSRHGPARIEASLKALGIDDETIRFALDDVFADGETAAARTALARFMTGGTKRESTKRRKAKAYRHLLSKGFAADLVQELVSGTDFGDTERLDDP